MKIVIDARLWGLENAGLGRYTMNLVNSLQKQDQKNDYTILLRKKYFEKLETPANWGKVLADFKHYSLAEQIKLPFLIRKLNPDIVHFPHFNVPVFYRGKYVVTIHDLLMHSQKGFEATTLPPFIYLIKRLGYRFVFDKAVRGAEKIIVPSKFVKKELVGWYKINKDKVTVTYEGLDEKLTGGKSKSLTKYKLKPQAYFLYVGNAYPHKNVMRAIEAVAGLGKVSGRKKILAIASSRDVFAKKLEKKVRKMKLEGSVKILGFVPDEDLGTLYKHSLAFVYPSFSEGFGLQGLEAFSLETLVLASDIPTFHEIYKDHALYFNPHDFSSIQKTMELVLNMDKEKREKTIKEAKEFAKRYSWDKMASQTVKIYESSISIRPS